MPTLLVAYRQPVVFEVATYPDVLGHSAASSRINRSR
jgi:hypothetical protein